MAFDHNRAPDCSWYPGFVFRTLRGDGIAAEALLDGTQLTESLLCDPDYRCDFARLRRFYRNAIEHSGDPHVGIRLARRFRAGVVGLPFLTAAKAASLVRHCLFDRMSGARQQSQRTGNAGFSAVADRKLLLNGTSNANISPKRS